MSSPIDFEHHSINYIEFAATDLEATKTFFEETLDWVFTDYGEEYTAFSAKGLMGGFSKSESVSSSVNGAPLLVLFSKDLENSFDLVQSKGVEITKPIFSFPGGRRFQFKEPSGNELAVWGE
ncbi:VOC family protein [Vibrio nigripulchritudo]|uniref:VOC family protein n=1 Tax=Vibrio nigripulchritudo TaxID=28173 RepID=UPI0003B20F26|nr:VOC family protein [Vibrio nigripulchritudo]CCN72791.1 putative Glyoxalase/Bleomycin resistance protein/Dihydroxybiphenyl dioxygenase [Vibrio nigripulchritudo SFn118]